MGDTREHVLQVHGKPTSIAKVGTNEIFGYPNGARVRFIDGKVVEIRGTLPAPIAPATAATPPTRSPPPGKQPPAASPTPAAAPPQSDALVPAQPDLGGAINTAALQELANRVEKMNTPWGELAPPETHSPLDSLPEILTGLLLRFGFTLLALKIAFKMWEMDAFWKGILIICGIDVTLHAIFKLLGPVTNGFTTIAAVENGIPGLVLIYTIHRFCFNKQIQNAVLTAALVKVVVMLCYVFAGVALLNLLYG